MFSINANRCNLLFRSDERSTERAEKETLHLHQLAVARSHTLSHIAVRNVRNRVETTAEL